MDAQALTELQNAIVVSAANVIEERWDAAVVNIEIDVIDGEQTENCLALSFAKEQKNYKRSSFQLPFECYDLFVTLRNSMASTENEKWKSCTLEIDSSGKYKFSYSYDTPRRLNGLHDDEAMLKDFVPRPL